jgi:integrase
MPKSKNPKHILPHVPGNKNWRARGPVPDRAVKFFYTREEADAWLDGLRQAKRDHTYIPAKLIPLFGETTAQFLASRVGGGYRPNTAAYYRAQCRHLSALAEYRLSAISVDVVEKFRDRLKAEGALSDPTINRVLTTGVAIFVDAIRLGLAVKNPFALAKRLRKGSAELKEGEEEREAATDCLEPPEIKKLLEAARPGYDRTLLLTLADTGARIGEVLALRWADLELDARRLYVQRSLSWTAAKENQPAAPVYYEPKTKAGKRCIPFPMELAVALKRWKLQATPNPHDLVFANANGQPPHPTLILRTALHPACRRAGLRQVGFHSLRHSYASRLISANTPINQISAYLGHANSAITLSTYVHFFKRGDDHSVVDRVFGSNGDFLDTSAEKNSKSA